MFEASITYWCEDLNVTNAIEFLAFNEEDAKARALAIVNRGIVHGVCEDWGPIKSFFVTYEHRGAQWATSVDSTTKGLAQQLLLTLQTYGCWSLALAVPDGN